MGLARDADHLLESAALVAESVVQGLGILDVRVLLELDILTFAFLLDEEVAFLNSPLRLVPELLVNRFAVRESSCRLYGVRDLLGFAAVPILRVQRLSERREECLDVGPEIADPCRTNKTE